MEKITLPNGLRLILAPMPGVAATALILVEAGSEYEKKRTNGVSHFLEHMVFKGTRRRPAASAIAEELDGLGAEYNAFTGQEFTGYWAKAEKEKLIKVLDLVSDLYLEPLFDAKEIEKERGVITEELNMYEDLPPRKAGYAWMELLYGDQPAGWRIGGTRKTVAGITRKDIADYRAERYSPGTTIVAVGGDFDAEKVKAFTVERFGALSKRRVRGKTKTKPSPGRARVKLVLHKTSDQTHIILGAPTFPVTDKRHYAADILAHLLGGGMSARLFKQIREEMGAAYYVRAESEHSLDRGYLAVSAGVTPSKLELVVKTVVKELARLRTEPVSEAELRRVKDHLIGTFLLEVETSDELASYAAQHELFTKTVLSPKELAARFEAVTPGDLMRIARKYFRDGNLYLALVGQVKNPKRLESLLKIPA